MNFFETELKKMTAKVSLLKNIKLVGSDDAEVELVASGDATLDLNGQTMPNANLIVNGNFEQGDDRWIQDAYITAMGYTSYEVRPGEGRDGSTALYIRNDYLNDARFVQEVEVEVLPTGDYCNIPMHRTWPVMFAVSAVINAILIFMLSYLIVRKKNTDDTTPLVSYDIDDDMDF